jgi:1-acyl-sn-glycerol-3-phosphate acyltransferase
LSQLARIGQTTRDLMSWRRFFAHTVVYCSTSVAARFTVGQKTSQKLMKGWCAGVVRQVGIDILAEGTERLVPGEPRVIVANHLSALDIPVIGAVMDIDYRWVAKKSLFFMPFIGWHLWASGHISIDRKRAGNLERMRARVRDVFDEGGSLLFFAEGTRSRDGALQKFKNGAFATAVTEGVPVLPLVVDGTERLLVKGSIAFPNAGEKKVRIRVLDPIEPMGEGGGEFAACVVDLRNRTRRAMVAALDGMRGGPGLAERPTI